MCGIAAIFRSRHDSAQDSLETMLLSMLGAIRHRGDTFHFAEREVSRLAAMGTNRLAIVDRDHAVQPIHDQPSGRRIIMNGEIYNHAELRSRLIECGRTFMTTSDTEVVLQGYCEWGVGCLDLLDGIFSFIIFNSSNEEIFAARDHLGIKPLYYARHQSLLLFASERKYFIGLTSDVQELQPGHYMLSDEIRCYVRFASIPTNASSDSEAAEQCRTLLHAAVRKQVATDLPLAVIFSGGLDSTIILHLASLYHGDVTAFSIGTTDSADLSFAKRFCSERDIRHVVTSWNSEQIARNIPRAIYEGEFFEPIDISDMLTMSAVYASVAANGFKVAISGDGSDEIFAGYDLFKSCQDPHALATYRVGNLYRTDLQRTDRSSMARSVECRVPFLDRELVDFALGLPTHLKIRDGVEKYVLREAFRDEIPSYMIDRPKIRMPEGIGVHDRIFQALASLPSSSVPIPDSIAIDTVQLRGALEAFLSYGFAPPHERYKREGKDYTPGGYFHFSSTAGDNR